MKDDKWIEVWQLFEGICVLCYANATSIHEIVPRSVLPSNWNTIDNRVPLCSPCHNQVQEKPDFYAELLRTKRDILLKMLGKTI